MDTRPSHRRVDKDGKFLRQWGRQGTKEEGGGRDGGAFMGVVHCVVMDNSGLVYVCDRQGNRIQVFDKMGNFKKSIWINRGTKNARLMGHRLVDALFSRSGTESCTSPMAARARPYSRP